MSRISCQQRHSSFVPQCFLQLSYIDLSWQSNTYDNCTTSDGNVVEPLYKMGEPDNGWNYGLEGEFFKNVGPLQNIVHIDIEWNYFTGSISHDIKNLQNLGKYLPQQIPVGTSATELS